MIARPLTLFAAGALAAGGGLLTLRDDGGESTTAPSLDGAALFHAKGCATCHDGPGTTTVTAIGPSLDDAPTWAGRRIDGVAAEDYVAQSIVSPQSFISPAASGQAIMPTLAVGPDELDALVAYLLGTS